MRQGGGGRKNGETAGLAVEAARQRLLGRTMTRDFVLMEYRVGTVIDIEGSVSSAVTHDGEVEDDDGFRWQEAEG